MVDRAVKSGDLATLDTVAAEIRDNAMTASEPAARRAVATTDINDEIVDDALAKFGRPYARFGTRDIRTCLEMIDRMYADMWSGPRMADAAARRRRVKERNGMGKGRPSLGAHGADFVIFSTAAAYFKTKFLNPKSKPSAAGFLESSATTFRMRHLAISPISL